MELRIINDLATYDQFVKNSPYVHYMKTSMWAKVKANQGYKAHYIGFYLHDELIATALGLENSYLFNRYLYIPNGLCIDYENKELLSTALGLLTDYAAKLHLTFLRIDPNVQRCPRDIVGNQLPGFDHDDITQTIVKNGFVHKGYNFAYDGSWYNRYTLAIDLNDDIAQIKKRFNKQKITSLNRHAIIGLTTHIGSFDDLSYLCDFETIILNPTIRLRCFSSIENSAKSIIESVCVCALPPIMTWPLADSSGFETTYSPTLPKRS